MKFSSIIFAASLIGNFASAQDTGFPVNCTIRVGVKLYDQYVNDTVPASDTTAPLTCLLHSKPYAVAVFSVSIQPGNVMETRLRSNGACFYSEDTAITAGTGILEELKKEGICKK